MDLPQAVTTCFKKYATFSGRASRSEFWYFQLFLYLALSVAEIFDSMFFLMGEESASMGSDVIGLVVWLGTLIPNFAVWSRRLHDTDRSAWWIAPLFIIPLIYLVITSFTMIFTQNDIIFLAIVALVFLGNFITIIVWFCQKGTDGENRFGPDPLL